MRYAHFCKICEICCDRMIAINRYPYLMQQVAVDGWPMYVSVIFMMKGKLPIPNWLMITETKMKKIK